MAGKIQHWFEADVAEATTHHTPQAQRLTLCTFLPHVTGEIQHWFETDIAEAAHTLMH
jgi:hypothetical protein